MNLWVSMSGMKTTVRRETGGRKTTVARETGLMIHGMPKLMTRNAFLLMVCRSHGIPMNPSMAVFKVAVWILLSAFKVAVMNAAIKEAAQEPPAIKDAVCHVMEVAAHRWTACLISHRRSPY